MASLYQNQGRYAEAEPLYVQALTLSRQYLGEEHPSVSVSLNNLAMLYQSQGRYIEAELLSVQALALMQRVLEEEDPVIAIGFTTWQGCASTKVVMLRRNRSMFKP